MEPHISDTAFKVLYDYLRSERAIHCRNKESTRRFLAVFVNSVYCRSLEHCYLSFDGKIPG